MLNGLYFHEKCNADIKHIIHYFLSKDYEKRASEFLNALIEAYQQLYDTPNAGDRLWDRDHFDPSLEKKYIPVSGFPYMVIFVKFPHGRMVVLSIVYCKKAMTYY